MDKRPAFPDFGNFRTAFRGELRDFSLRGPRARSALRTVASVLIALHAAHALHLQDSWWAAISAFAVMQADFRTTLARGAHRLFGTVCGAAVGVLVAPAVAGHPVGFVVAMTAAAWAGLFVALVMRHSYAWVLALVTFMMVVCEALSATASASLQGFAMERVANVAVGTAACIVVAGIGAWIAALTRVVGARASPDVPLFARDQRRVAAVHALHGAIAIAVLSAAVVMGDLGHFSQAMVTTIAVLIVPFESSAIAPGGPVQQRMVQRFAGCFIAGAVAFALLPLIGGQPLWCQAALCVGVWAGAYLQRGDPSLRYVAVQFSVAFLMVFVQDRGWTVNDGPALQRLYGVFAGVAALAFVLVLSRALRRIP